MKEKRVNKKIIFITIILLVLVLIVIFNNNIGKRMINNIKYGASNSEVERINIRASDYRFEDKKKYYQEYTNQRWTIKDATENEELKQLSTSHQDFTEEDILEGNTKIINTFINYLDENNLIK